MRTINICMAVLAGCLTSGVAMAAETASKVSAIRAGRLIDVTNGKVLGGQVIIVRDGRIEAVGAADSVAIPAGATVIDLTLHTVLPGLIDAHTHITGDPTLPPYYGYGNQQGSRGWYNQADGRRYTTVTVTNRGQNGYRDDVVQQQVVCGSQYYDGYRTRTAPRC